MCGHFHSKSTRRCCHVISRKVCISTVAKADLITQKTQNEDENVSFLNSFKIHPFVIIWTSGFFVKVNYVHYKTECHFQCAV